MKLTVISWYIFDSEKDKVGKQHKCLDIKSPEAFVKTSKVAFSLLRTKIAHNGSGR